MAYSAVAGIAPQYENYANYWLKAYEQGTTTPLVMALDSAGSTTVAKLELDSAGFINTTGNARVIPYVNAAYDAWLIPTEAEADANDLTNAIQVADDITLGDVVQNTIDIATNTADIATNTANIATNTTDIATNTAAIAANFQKDTLNARITLTSGLAVTTADVTAATNVYLTPFNGDSISLYDGSAWASFSFTEITTAVPATTDTNYDVFVYDSSGVTVELVAWSTDTARATAITEQNDIKVKSGDATKRYVGTFRTTGVSGQTEDSKAKRFVWNYYNRFNRAMEVLETTNSWVYTSGTIRQANGSTANQLAYVVGFDEDIVSAEVNGLAISTLTNKYAAIGIGVDSTTVMSVLYNLDENGNGGHHAMNSSYVGNTGIGYHYLAWLEAAEAAGTNTFYGDGAVNPALSSSGITGVIIG